MSGRTKSSVAGYGLAIVMTATALLLRRALHQLVKDAVHFLVFHFFDLLLSDLGLMRGLCARGCKIPGTALSHGHEQDIRESHGAGFAAHRIKPASPDRLAEMTLVVTARREVIYGRTDSARGPQPRFCDGAGSTIELAAHPVDVGFVRNRLRDH